MEKDKNKKNKVVKAGSSKISKSHVLEKGGINSYCQFFAENKLDELIIEEQNFKLRLARRSASPSVSSQAAYNYDIAEASLPRAADAAITDETHSSIGSSAEVETISLGEKVPAPMTGTFYSAPSPESPPFITVGQSIRKGHTICILEAMKIMNEIESPVSGTVKKILFKNGDNVKKGDTILHIQK